MSFNSLSLTTESVGFWMEDIIIVEYNGFWHYISFDEDNLWVANEIGGV